MSFTPHLSNRAFTLIETVVTISILVVVGGALATLITYIYRTNTYVLQESTAVQSAQSGLRAALKNLREASYSDDGAYPIQQANPTDITFYADTNSDGTVEKVRVYLLNGTLFREVTTSAGNPPSYVGQPITTSTIATYVVNASSTPIFVYSDANGTVLSGTIDTAHIASIGTTLQIDVNPNRSPVPYTLAGSATLRNLR